MKHSDDKRRLFFDMQEHPENYSDEALEQMMAELDKEPDTEKAWQRLNEEARMKKQGPTAEGKVNEEFAATVSSSLTSSRQAGISLFQRIAAIFIAAAFIGGLAFAAWHAFSPTKEQPTEAKDSSLVILHSSLPSPVRFSDIRLDSILTVVSAHYGKCVRFRDEELRGMKLITTWNPADSLPVFIEHINMFDYLHLTLQKDTIYVESANDEEDE